MEIHNHIKFSAQTLMNPKSEYFRFILYFSVCERQILIPYPDCQIQSNMVLSSAPEHAAANILSETLAWSAPIRTGPK